MESYNEVVQDVRHTLFVRGDTWVKIVQWNVPTEGLLDAVVQQVRPDRDITKTVDSVLSALGQSTSRRTGRRGN